MSKEKNKWVPPTPDEVRALRSRHGLTQAALAGIARVEPRHVQRFEASVTTNTYQPPSRAVWELVLLKLGELAVDEHRNRETTK